MYYQKELSGNIKFWGVDFNTVYGCALRTKFVLLVFDRRKGEIARCEFRKTDCKWDINHCTCDVDVSSWNPYKKIEAGKDNEYNLVKILTEKRTLGLYTYPVKETWVMGSTDMVVCTGLYAQSVAVMPTNNEGTIIGQFGKVVSPVVGTAVILSGEGSGRYVGGEGFVYNSSRTGVSYSFYNEDESYRITALGSAHDGIGGTLSDYWWNTITLTRMSDMATVGTLTIGGGTAATEREDGYIKGSYNGLDAFNNNTADNPLTFSNGSTFIIRVRSVMSRLTSRANLLSGWTAFNDENIRTDEPMKYWKASQGIVKGSIRVGNSGQYSGRYPVDGGGYYLPPDDNDGWVAMWHESWLQGMSMWVKAGLVYRYPLLTPTSYYNAASSPSVADIDNYKSEETVNDFYTLGDAIKAVLHEIDPSLHFEPDTTHSQFLFSDTNPVGGAQEGKLYISQKSNVLNLGYDYPAWQAPITWGRIETLLNNAFNCYWEIYEKNGERHLRIEHRTYFENGGTYNGSSLAETIDLRSIYRTANRTRLSDKTNRWEWDKDGGSVSSNANRYEYGWMDTQSVIFDGETIEVPELYQLFEDERVEERKVDWFSSDIDFLTSVQAECSSDGFVLVMESLSGNGWIIGGHPNYTGQNYQLSLEYLQPLYLLTGIYSSVVKIGDTEYPNRFTSRMRKAEIDFSLPEGVNIEAGDILWTEVGKGVTETLEQDISSDKWTATVRYENE